MAMKAMAATKTVDAKRMKPTKRWTFLKSLLEHAKFCDDESVEKDCYAMKDPTEHVETLGATITDATEWDVIPVGYFFKNGRVKFKYIWVEQEQ